MLAYHLLVFALYIACYRVSSKICAHGMHDTISYVERSNILIINSSYLKTVTRTNFAKGKLLLLSQRIAFRMCKFWDTLYKILKKPCV